MCLRLSRCLRLTPPNRSPPLCPLLPPTRRKRSLRHLTRGPTWVPSLTALLGLGFPHPIITELSPAHTVLGLSSSATRRAHPKPHPRRGRSARSLHLFVDRRRLEPLLARPDSGAARRCRRSYRRPCHHRCRRRSRCRRACQKKPRRRGSPVAAGGAIPSVLRSVGRLEGARSSRPAASHCPPLARPGAGSELPRRAAQGCSESPEWAGIPSLCWIRGAGTTFPE